jgi:hypothetical protein
LPRACFIEKIHHKTKTMLRFFQKSRSSILVAMKAQVERANKYAVQLVATEREPLTADEAKKMHTLMREVHMLNECLHTWSGKAAQFGSRADSQTRYSSTASNYSAAGNYSAANNYVPNSNPVHSTLGGGSSVMMGAVGGFAGSALWEAKRTREKEQEERENDERDMEKQEKEDASAADDQSNALPHSSDNNFDQATNDVGSWGGGGDDGGTSDGGGGDSGGDSGGGDGGGGGGGCD